MKQILILGDSFTYGHGCDDRVYYYDFEKKEFVGDQLMYRSPPSEHCWASLLQKDFPELKVINIATVGRSMQGMFHDLYTYFFKIKKETGLEPDIDMIMFNGTMSDRIEIVLPFGEDAICSWGISWEQYLPSSSKFPEADDRALAKQLYAKWLYHEDVGETMSLSALYGAHSFATSRGIKFLWSIPNQALAPQKREVATTVLWSSEIPALCSYDFSTVIDNEYNKQFVGPDNHAHNLGHIEYYKREILPRMLKQYREGN